MPEEPMPWGYRGNGLPELLRIVGWLVAACCTLVALFLVTRTQDLASEGLASGGVLGGAAAVFGAGVVALCAMVGVGATLEHTIAIRAHLDGTVPLRPPPRAGAGAPKVFQEVFDVRLIAVGEHPDRVARELRQAVPEERIPELMANLPSVVADGVGYATAKGLELGLTEKGATVEMSRRGGGD